MIERVSTLFSGHPVLISGFNTFLPPGYRIECTTGENQLITVITPTGTLTQNAAGSLTMQHLRPAMHPIRSSEPRPRSLEAESDAQMVEPDSRPTMDALKRDPAALTLPSKPSTPVPSLSHVTTPQPQPQPQITQSQPISPHVHPELAQPQPVLAPTLHSTPIAPPQNTIAAPMAPLSNPLSLTPTVSLNSSSTTASAASVLGGMHRVTSNPEPVQQSVHPPAAFHPSLPQAQPSLSGGSVSLAAPGSLPGPGIQPQQPEFYHAIQYINRIKTRFADEPETYKQFLEILQTYQKEQRLLHDVSVLWS